MLLHLLLDKYTCERNWTLLSHQLLQTSDFTNICRLKSVRDWDQVLFPKWCRNFGKELVILFHRTAAAPWGHVASIIKRSSTGDSLAFGSTTNTVSIGPFRSSPLTAYLFGTFHHPGPKSDERTCWVKRNRTHTVKFQQAFYLHTYSTHFTFTNLIKPTLPSTLHQTYQTFTKPYRSYNLNKPNHILHLELFLELSFLNCYLHIRCLFHLV